MSDAPPNATLSHLPLPTLGSSPTCHSEHAVPVLAVVLGALLASVTVSAAAFAVAVRGARRERRRLLREYALYWAEFGSELGSREGGPARQMYSLSNSLQGS